MTSYPLLEALFGANLDGYGRVADGDPAGVARRQAEMLLEQSACIAGVEKLARDGASSTGKFVNVLAELRFAHLLHSVGARTAILGDDAFRPAKYTPDLSVEFPSGLKALVEVVHGSSGSPTLANELVTRLIDRKLSFHVVHFLGHRLSVSAPSYVERHANELLAAEVADEVVAAVATAHDAGATKGIVRVFAFGAGVRADLEYGEEALSNLYDEVTCNSGETWIGTFGFDPSPTADAGGGVTSAHFLDEAAQKAKFLGKMRAKSAKRRALPLRYASVPFIVALENDESELHPIAVLSALTGSRQYVRGFVPDPARLPPWIVASAASPWAPLLSEWNYVGEQSMRFADYGAYSDTQEPWASDLSGVLVTHHGRNVTQWLPNPFAAHGINDPRLLQVGLGIDKLGVFSSAE